VGKTADAIAKSKRLLELGVMVVGFGYRVVPKGEARLRIQGSAGLEDEHIERALAPFSRLWSLGQLHILDHRLLEAAWQAERWNRADLS
jgi:hypothetical protein